MFLEATFTAKRLKTRALEAFESVIGAEVMSKYGRRQRTAPEGFDYIEPVLTALENELRESKSMKSVR